ncbi:restriction endonuclease subunit S [Levilactobacillus brevis]|uniref:restriction endonuclease subunit S n=1 Tax=Levilactobacillus brevis TaxID=1580 RepID=UPI001BA72E73|nr:restriction endonuclease subunit S [Levilactobacillus brevis]MBS1013860.1 restriction endonuclease subunit S [Levilactobacillus brevis]
MKDQQASYPQLRFKGFTDSWEQRKLSNLAERVTRKNKNNESGRPLTISAQDGLIDQNDFFDKQIASRDVSGYFLVKNGEFAYNKSYSNGYPWGAIKRLDKYDMGVLSTLYIIFRPTNVSSQFLVSYYDTTRWYKEVAKNAAEGARNHGLLNIAPTDFFSTVLIIPNSIEEQQKIGSFFKQLDHLITLHQRKLAKLKELKQGYLQKLFPKNGSKFPQLRFAGFADAWEQRKFEYLLDENDGIRRGPFGSALKKECFVSQSDYVVYEQQNAIYNKYETRYNITKDKFEELKKFELKPEDFIMSGAGTIGRISRVPHGIDKGVFNQALIRFRIDNRITDSEYFLQFIRADFMQKKLTSTNPGSAITNLVPMSEVKKWGILVPKINEQSKIGIFLKQLDKTIALHQRKLEKLQELKKGYLQKMFC